ncbi:MAG: bifunctional DNA primase/polymerase [Nitrospira sp.]
MNTFKTDPFFIAAMAYTKRGWAVLPLTPQTKQPLGKLVPHGLKDATTDQETIARWWQCEPMSNIGIRTGAASGLVVLDIDPRNGGSENLRELEQQNGELPHTVMSLTGGGGIHIFFQHPSGFTKNKTLAPGVEVKADGAYVVAPPSIHPSGEVYQWEVSSHPDDLDLATLPKWLLQLMSREGTLKSQPSDPAVSTIPEGQRHNTLVSLAGTMRWKGMSPKAISEALLIENHSRCTPPLPDQEVTRIAQSMTRYEPASRTNGAVAVDEWPRSLAEEAYHGLLGEIATTIEPHTEADQAAILLQILVAFGNVLNRRPHFRVEADIHALNLYVVLVGQTAKGRKGTSWGRVRQLFRMADPDWSSQRIHSGLSSGEGLIWHVRDPIYKEEPIRDKREVVGYQSVRIDPGIEDKRLLILESELALVLRILQRDGNTLSAVIRQAWDHGDLRVLTKNNPVAATGAHISIIGHITQDELRRYLDDTETANGFANRFLWICVRRSKCLPEGGHLREEDLEPLVYRLKAAIQFGRLTGQISLDEEARELWHKLYPKLSTGHPGLLGNVTSRADPLVIRLSCLYALLDQSTHIRVEHLKAGAEVWRYGLDSCRYIFRSTLGDQVADRILATLRQHPEGMTRTAINGLFGNNKAGRDIERGLDLLISAGLARQEEEITGGRPATRWYANSTTETI